MRIWLLVCIFIASGALAAPPKPRVLLSGPAAVTKVVSKALSKKFNAQPLKKNISPLPTTKEVREVTLPAGATAVVICKVSGGFASMLVLNGHDGVPLDTVTVKWNVKKPPKAMPAPELAALILAVSKGKAPKKTFQAAEPPEEQVQPAKPSPKPEPLVNNPYVREPEVEEEVAKPVRQAPRESTEPAKEEPSASSSAMASSIPTQGSPYPAVRASIGVGGFSRSLSWAGEPSDLLATGSQPFSGDISVDASWYPGAHFTSNFLAHLGVFITHDFGIGMASKLKEQDSRFAHSANRLRLGALVRLPLGERLMLNAHLGYSRHALTTSTTAVNDTTLRPNFPDVLFNGFRGGLGLRVRVVGSFEVDMIGGFQAVSGLGELASARFFPKATAFAVDVGGGLSIELVPHLRVRAGIEWQRYFVSLNPDETTLYPAQKASDQYFLGTAALQWVM